MKTTGNIKDKIKLSEFELRTKNYSEWRWSGVSFYQGIFIAFVTAAIILLLDILAGQDLFLKIIVLAFLIFGSYELYKKMLKQTQKPVFICDNMIGTLEGEPKLIKDKDGKGYYVMNISGVHHQEDKK